VEDKGEEHTGMHSSGCDTLDQERLSEQQAKALRNRGQDIKIPKPAMFDSVDTCQRDYLKRQHHGYAVTAGTQGPVFCWLLIAIPRPRRGKHDASSAMEFLTPCSDGLSVALPGHWGVVDRAIHGELRKS
jgi:hypothetical protein